MKILAKIVMITALGITMATPVKRAADPLVPQCATWIGTAPFCNVSPNDCPNGYSYSGISSQDAHGHEQSCSTGTKYLCIKGNIPFS